MHELMHDLIRSWCQFVIDYGYVAVFLLMAAESSILPVPSEVVIPPAAFGISQGTMTFTGIVIAGTLGSLLGASVMYAVSYRYGRPLVLRYGKILRITPEKLERTEQFLERYELGGIFFARLLPVVRHVIGIPAGIMRMRFVPYCVMTVIGSAVWCSALAWFGQEVFGDDPTLLNDPDRMYALIKSKAHWIAGGALLLFGLYILMMWVTRRRATK